MWGTARLTRPPHLSPGGGGAHTPPEETEGDRGRAGQILGEPEGRAREAGVDGDESLRSTCAVTGARDRARGSPGFGRARSAGGRGGEGGASPRFLQISPEKGPFPAAASSGADVRPSPSGADVGGRAG